MSLQCKTWKGYAFFSALPVLQLIRANRDLLKFNTSLLCLCHEMLLDILLYGNIRLMQNVNDSKRVKISNLHGLEFYWVNEKLYGVTRPDERKIEKHHCPILQVNNIADTIYTYIYLTLYIFINITIKVVRSFQLMPCYLLKTTLLIT